MYKYLTLSIATILLFISNTAYSESSDNIWLQNQLNAEYMHTITKHQCMLKSIGTLKTVCKSDGCIKTVAGLTGDCIEDSKGTIKELCTNFNKKYIEKYCLSGYLDKKRCALLYTANKVSCKNKNGG